MKRALRLVVSLALGTWASGCSMCQNPYDYTGPVAGPTPGACADCGSGGPAAGHGGYPYNNARVGSVLSGPSAPTGPVPAANPPTPQQEAPTEGSSTQPTT